jgi:3-hydroxyacyl-CoA dehydrogenase
MRDGRRWSGSAPLSRSPTDRLSFHAEPEEALAGVVCVQESVPERVEVKRALQAGLDAAPLSW